MKRFFYIAITLIAIFGCQNEPKKNTNSIDSLDRSKVNALEEKVEYKKTELPPVDPSAWKIDNTIALKMKKFLNGCALGCVNNTMIIDSNKRVYDAIKALYPNSVITAVPARYKDKADEDRYCSLRHLTAPGACNVKNHKTFIYRVVPGTSAAGKPTGSLYEPQQTELYYDIFTICPPPRDCGSSDTSFHHD